MKFKKIQNFIFVFSSIVCFSQNTDFDLAFTYKVKAKFYKHIEEGNANENMLLLIGKNKSLYISPYRYKIDSARVAIKSRGGSISELLEYSSKFPDFVIGSSIFKNLNKNELHYDRQNTNVSFRIEEDIPLFKWEIKNENKKILNYNCQLATLKYKGRVYKAWFSTQIPIQNGPWKFGGLPGLILKIEDIKNEFSFELIGVSNKKHTYLRNQGEIIYVKDKNVIKSFKNYYKQFLSNLSNSDSKNNLKEKINRMVKTLEKRNNIELK